MGYGLTLAERPLLPDVAYDVEQVARHLDHTAWSAITAAEDEIGRLACAQLSHASPLVAPAPCEAVVGFALRALEGALRFGRPSFGARDAAWALAVHDDDRGAGGLAVPPVDAVYAAVLDAIQQVAPSAELAARTAAHAIMEEAASIATQGDGSTPAHLETPIPIPPLAFRGLADLPHVAYVVDRALCFAYVNQAWETFAQQNDGDACLMPSVIGQSWIDSIGGPDREHWLAVAEQLLAGALPSYREEIPCHSASECRFIVVTASPLRLAEEDLAAAGLVFVTYDVTDLRRAESERLWLDQEGRRVRDVVLGTVAHDLRSPLTAIKGRAQLLRRKVERAETPLAASLEDSLSAIEATADQMADQIDELLDAAQAQAGQPAPLRSRPTDLVALIQGILEYHQDVLQGQRLLLQVPPEPLVGRWDDVRIRRVIENLVSNAIKYSPDGGNITVRAWPERIDGHAWAAFSVQDQGIGIPAADLPNIFSSFFRGSNVDADTGGFGLGLAGVHQIVGQHGGHIDAASTVGVGTTFTVWLPLDAEAGQLRS
jgi:signal transduction histidine kinase